MSPLRGYLLLAFLLGCGGGSSDGFGPAASMSVLSGGGQQAPAGTELPEPIVVRVTDANGAAVPNQILNFVVISGGGSVFGGTTQTNAQGEARERWTLGTVAGEQTIEARAVDQSTGAPIVFGRITATALPGPMAFLRIDYNLRMFVSDELDLAKITHASDQYGNEIPNPPVSGTAEPPLRVQGTTLASTAEGTGNLTVTSGELAFSASVTAFLNLTELVGATGRWSCEGSRLPPNEKMTFESVTFVVDSVHSVMGLSNPYVELFISTTTIQVLSGDTTTAHGHGVLPAEQGLGYLDWGFPSGTLVGAARRISDSPLSYSGGYACYYWTVTKYEEFTLSH